MGRRRTDRWIAVCGGVLVNGLILGALVLIEEPAPVVEEQPTILVELERPQRQKLPSARLPAASGSPSVAAPTSSDLPAISAGLAVAAGSASNAPPDIDPQWRIEQKSIDRWKLTEGVPAANWGRYYRACSGLSNEHMTPDEKERCYGGWSSRRDKRPSPSFVGPIDETKWETPGPKVAPDQYEVRKQRCRDYRRGRTPGFSERNLASTGSPPPSLREGGCF